VSSGQRGSTQDDITSKTTKFAQAQNQVPHAGIKRKSIKYSFYMAEKWDVQLINLCASLVPSLVDFSVSSVSSSLDHSTFLRPLAPSSSSRSTSLQLLRRVRQVARPSSSFIIVFVSSLVVFVRLLDLPLAQSSSSSGRSTFLWLRRHNR
jgi:hypothetical protein